MAKTKTEPTAPEATDPTTTEPTAPETTPTGGPVTFVALAAPGQAFTFNGGTYQFHQGEFTTEDPDLVAFLDQNANARRK